MTVHPPIIVAETEVSVFPTLLRVLKLTRAYQNLRLADIGLQSGQDEFLLALADDEPKCVCDLARQLEVRPSTISKMIDVLSARGLVQRASSDQDHRKTFIRPTAAGTAMRAAIRDIWHKLDAELLQSAAALNTASLRRELGALDGHITKRLGRLR